MELKLKASVEKERLKVQKAEVDLKRDETRKRKSIELKDQEFDQKKALQSHRFKCMSKVHSQKEILKKKTHKERMDESASRLLRAQAIQNAPGTFPGIGGGEGSIERAVQWYSRQTQLKEPSNQQPVLQQASYDASSAPPLFVQQTLTQLLPSSNLSSSTPSPTSSYNEDLLPPGWTRFVDPNDGSPVFIHENGKKVRSRLEIYKTPSPTKSTVDPSPNCFSRPDKVLSDFPRPIKSYYMNGSAEKPIELAEEDDSDKENGFDKDNENILGQPESSLVYGPQDSYSLRQDSNSESDSNSDSSATELGD